MLIKKIDFKHIIIIISIFSIFLGTLIFTQSYKNLHVFSFKERIKLSNASVPIVIDDADPTKNWSFCVTNYDWCSGSGTWNNPYVIEGLYFENLKYPDDALTIKNSNAVFILRNCMLYNCQFGFYLNDTNNGIIAYNSIIAHGVLEDWGWSRAIDLNYCENITLNNNFIIGEYEYTTIELEDCVNISLINNLGIDTNSRISLRRSNYCEISACNFGLLFDNSHYNQIKNNSLSEASITLDFSTFNNISNNKITISDALIGINLEYYSDNNIINQNELTTGAGGIWLWDNCDSNNITKNTITFENKKRQTNVGDHGISITRGLYNIIDANNISYYNFGLSLIWSNYSTITNNIFNHTRNCITQTQCSDNYVADNICIEPPSPFISGYSWFLLIFIVLSSLVIVIIKLRKKWI